MLIVHLFVSYAHVTLCHFFSSSWCQGLAATSACGSSWTFLFTFLLTKIGLSSSHNGTKSAIKYTSVIARCAFINALRHLSSPCLRRCEPSLMRRRLDSGCGSRTDFLNI